MQKNLRTIIFAGLYAVPFVPFLVSSSFFFPYITTKAFVFRLVVEIVFACWLVLAALAPEYRPKKTWLTYLVLAFLVIVGLADVLGVAPVKSMWSNFERMEGYVLLLHLGALFLVMGSVFKEENWQKWWNTTLVASFLMILYCLLQILGLKTISQGGVRVDGTFGNAIYLAVYLLFHIFITGILLSRQWKNRNLKWAYSVLILLQIFVLYFTATRGTILGLLGGVIIFALLNIRNREVPRVRQASVALLAGLVVLIGGFFSVRHSTFVTNSPVLSRFASLSLSELQSQGRYYIWPMAWEGIKEHPLLGWGQENFGYVFQKYYDPEMYNLEPWFDRAHNVFLDWAIAGGLLAVLAYIGFYVAALYYLWKRSQFSYLEKSLFTSLLAAYFFHNVFVFDNLGSYILFFSVLAYINSRVSAAPLWQKSLSVVQVKNAIVPVAVLVFVLSFYVTLWRPLSANSALIGALKSVQSGQYAQSIESFQDAYAQGPTGQQEILEQMAVNSSAILSSPLPIEQRNQFFSFVKQAAIEQGEKFPEEVRVLLISGLFLTSTGASDEGLSYLERAKELSPRKQDIYFNIGSAYFNKNEGAKALEALRTGYELAPTFSKARVLYLVGAIYVGNGSVERELRAKFTEQELAFDDTILGAYYSMKRFGEARALLEARKRLDPANASTYDEYLKQVGQ